MSRLALLHIVIAAALSPVRTAAQPEAPGSAAPRGLPPLAVRAAVDPAQPAWYVHRAALPHMAPATFAGASPRAPSRRSPIIAGTLGFIVPGAGHFYADEPGRGVTVLAVTMVGAFFALSDGTTTAVATAGSVAYVGGWTFSVVDGTLAAHRYNRRHP